MPTFYGSNKNVLVSYDQAAPTRHVYWPHSLIRCIAARQHMQDLKISCYLPGQGASAGGGRASGAETEGSAGGRESSHAGQDGDEDSGSQHAWNFCF
jgi:hypothetical protein